MLSNNYISLFETYKNLRIVEATADSEYIESVLTSIYEDINSYIETECIELPKPYKNIIDKKNIRSSISSTAE